MAHVQPQAQEEARDSTVGGGYGEAPSQAHLRAARLPSFRACLERSGMSEEGFIGALLQTSLSRLKSWTLPDLERLLAASLRYNLNPTGREIFLLPDHSEGAPLLVVGVDGWSRVLNEHEQFAGMVFEESEELVDGVPAWIECTIHRHDRKVATAVREYLCEVRGATSAWITHPRRMLRHKALIQCARITFGMGDIVDPDEAQRARLDESDRTRVPAQAQKQNVYQQTKRGPTGVNELRSTLGL